jgi:hypothetical protein
MSHKDELQRFYKDFSPLNRYNESLELSTSAATAFASFDAARSSHINRSDLTRPSANLECLSACRDEVATSFEDSSCLLHEDKMCCSVGEKQQQLVLRLASTACVETTQYLISLSKQSHSHRFVLFDTAINGLHERAYTTNACALRWR